MFEFRDWSLFDQSASLWSFGKFANVFGGMKEIEMSLSSKISNLFKPSHIWGLMYLMGLESK